jgi:putative transcriptional regulator
MTINHHPREEMLLDYVSGALGETWSIAIATHLSVCPQCRRVASGLETLAGSVLKELSDEVVEPSTLDSVLSRLEEGEQRRNRIEVDSLEVVCLPKPLRDYTGGDLDSVRWKRLGPVAHQVVVRAESDGTVARLLRIPAGKPVPEHSHGGDEITLVLRGAFEDHLGLYERGDMQSVDASITHRPYAVPGEDCICLAVTDAPLQFRSMTARLLQPVVGI